MGLGSVESCRLEPEQGQEEGQWEPEVSQGSCRRCRGPTQAVRGRAPNLVAVALRCLSSVTNLLLVMGLAEVKCPSSGPSPRERKARDRPLTDLETHPAGRASAHTLAEPQSRDWVSSALGQKPRSGVAASPTWQWSAGGGQSVTLGTVGGSAGSGEFWGEGGLWETEKRWCVCAYGASRDSEARSQRHLPQEAYRPSSESH